MAPHQPTEATAVSPSEQQLFTKQDVEELVACFHVALNVGLEWDSEMAMDAAMACVGTLCSEAVPSSVIVRLVAERERLGFR
jgi:hypothetical protein